MEGSPRAVAEQPSWDSMREELRTCPYSLPDDRDMRDCVLGLLDDEAGLRQRVSDAESKLVAMGLREEIGGLQQDREIYESNAIEGAGTATLLETTNILSSEKSTLARDALARGMLVTSITNEPKLVDVLGLNNARILAGNILNDLRVGRPVTETDIRDLHRQSLPNKSFAGRYKLLPNSIEGADHTPALPIDTPRAMSELTTWMRSCELLPATLQATIVHAWLANIHPFDDGNGRVARLLVNLILARHGLPPVIIEHRTKRDDYIDALALSDEGGDILPLTTLLIKSQKKFVMQINRPAYLRKLVTEHVSQNDAAKFDRWVVQFHTFIDLLNAQLSQLQISLAVRSSFDSLTFRRLVDDVWDAEQWFAVAVDQRRNRQGVQVRIGLTTPPSEIYNRLDTNDYYPGLRMERRTPNDYDNPFRNLWTGSAVGQMRSVTVRPGPRGRVYVSYWGTPTRVQWGFFDDAAATVAEVISAALRDGRRPPRGGELIWGKTSVPDNEH